MLKTKLKALQRAISGSLAAVMCIGFMPVTPAHAAVDINDKAALIVATEDNIKHAALQGVSVRIECTSAGQYKDYGTHTSNGSGRVVIDNAPVGYYRITPLSAPEGYRVDPSPVLVYLKDSQGDAPITTITSYAQRALVIRKMDSATGKGLQGATFKVTGSQGTQVASVTTDAEGVGIVPTIAHGDYDISEINTPSGQYTANPQKVHIPEVPDGDTVVVFYSNNKNAIAVRLTDKMTGEPLENGTFELRKGTELIGTKTTDAQGFAFFPEVTASNYTLTETKFPEGYIQESISRTVEVKADGTTVSVPITNSKPGNLIVYSKDDKNQLLPGTLIQVHDDQNHLVGKATSTNDGGFVTFSGLKPGTYDITAQASEGYVLVSSSLKAKIEKNKTTTVEFISQAKPSLLISCVDNKGKPVSGAEFNLQSANAELPGSYTTQTDGTVLVQSLNPGDYTVTMKSVPAPYVVSTAVQTRTLRAGTQVKVNFVVYEKPSLEIAHFVKGTTIPLAGGQFELYKGSTRINSYTSDDSGRIFVENIDPGSYVVKHVGTAEGYTIDTASKAIDIQAGKSGYLEFTSSRKSSIAISKVDKLTNAPLAGAEFQIRTLDGITKDTVTTGSDGMATSVVLEPGQYIVSETHAPSGYVMDENSRIVTVKNNETSLQKFTNEKKSAIVVTARDFFGSPVPNAVFTITDSKTGVVLDTITTDSNGIAVSKVLDAGAYIVRETIVPLGYVAETGSMYDVPVSGEGATSVVFEHSRQTVIQIMNEMPNGDPISGGIFKVVNQATGFVVGYFTTDESGMVSTPILPSGTYIVTQVSAADGYTTKNERYTITLTDNKAAIVRFVNAKMSVINIKKTDRNTGAPLAGAVFTIADSSGHVVGRYTTDSTGCVTTQPLPTDTYLVREYYSPEGYLIDDSCRTNVVLKENENTSIEMTNRKAPVIQIVKEDADTGKLLSGAEFTVYDANGREIDTYVTDENGIATTKELSAGKYTVSESKAPEGYALNPNPYSLTLKAGETARLTVPNSRKSGLVINKVDEQGNPLAGAEFTITEKNGTVIATITTDVSGSASYDGLKPGDYFVKETKAPEGYKLDSAAKLVQIKENSGVNLKVVNKSMSSIIIKKEDSDTGKALAGARFQITDAAGQEVASLVSDSSGMAQTDKLPDGLYYVKETKAPEGYVIDQSVRSVTVRSGKPVNLTITNTAEAAVYIHLNDATTSQELDGGSFVIRDGQNSVVGQGKTVNGLLVIPKLPAGDYTVSQIAAPDGYIKDSAPQSITVSLNKATHVYFLNRASTGIVIESVVTTTHEPLAGCKYEVYNKEGIVVFEGTSSTDGFLATEALQPGRYTIKQLATPEGYSIVTSTQTVTVTNTKPVQVVFENQPLSSLIIELTDKKDGSYLAGAEFKIQSVEGHFVTEAVTDQGGMITISNLKPGFYLVTQMTSPNKEYILEGTYQFAQIVVGSNTKLIFTNEKQTGLVIENVVVGTHEPLAGGKFEIWTLNDNRKVFEGVTDATGTLQTDKLNPGKYLIKHLATADGYEIVTATQIIEVKTYESAHAVFENKPVGGLEITKVDSKTRKPLAGASFKVVSKNGSYETTVSTDATGIARVPDMKPGIYVVTEVLAPEGYRLENLSQNAVIRNGEMTRLTFANDKLTGIIINKTDADTGKPLADATFEISAENGKIMGTIKTDNTGRAETEALQPGRYTIKETIAPEGYIRDEAVKSVTVTDNDPTIVNFTNKAKAALVISKVDSTTGDSLPGAVFKVTKVNGDYVGEYTTERDGRVTLPTIEPGTYVITEIKAPEGYIKDSTPRTVEVKTGTPMVVTVENSRVAGLQIRKTVTQTGEPLKDVSFKVNSADGTLIGNYTTDAMGLIYVELSPGEYVVQETFAPDGYVIDKTPHFITVKRDDPVVLEITNDKLSEVKIHKIDAETGKGIYGTVFEIKDAKSNYIGTYTTDDQGYIDLSAVLADGKYVITEVKAAHGYVIDPIPRTVTVNQKEPTVIKWENSREKGQLKVTKFSAEDNAALNIPKNSRLAGAQFTITTLNGQVIDTIQTNANGEAYSGALDFGTYLVQETKAPAGYAVNNKPVQINVTDKNQKINISFYDKNLDVGLSIEKRGEAQVRPGNTMKYYFMNVKNVSDAPMNNFFFSDKLPTDSIRAQTLYTGTWSASVYYKIEYKTNMSDYKVLAQNLNSKTQYNFDLSSQSLGLGSGEYVTEIRFVMGTVPAGFHEMVSPVLYAYVLPNVPNNYQIVNRCEVGAQYDGNWVSNASSWTTLVVKPQVNLPDRLPTTGF